MVSEDIIQIDTPDVRIDLDKGYKQFTAVDMV
jgi:hypothetical protein